MSSAYFGSESAPLPVAFAALKKDGFWTNVWALDEVANIFQHTIHNTWDNMIDLEWEVYDYHF